jgi:DHA3 family macrolide efflux protein-like MFS transporter
LDSTRAAERRANPPASAPAPPSAPAQSALAAEFITLLRGRHTRTLFTAHFASTAGDWLAFMALFSLSAFEWRSDVHEVSLLAIAYMLPIALLSPVAGVWVDRWNLRRVLVASDLLRAGITLGMAYCSHFWTMCLLLLVHQTVSTFFNPAQQSAISRLVPPGHFLTANALNSQAGHLTKILGPAIAGILVSALGPRGCFYFDAATFALSGLLLATLPPLPSLRGTTTPARSFRREFGDGVQFVIRAPRLNAALLLLTLCLSALGALIALLPVFARDQLGAGPRTMGLLLSGLGAGAAVGAFFVAHAGRLWDKMWSIGGGTCIAGAASLLLSRMTHASLAVLSTTLLGIGVAIFLVPAYALFQEETPQEMLGRVTSLALAVLSVAQVIGMGIAGAAALQLAPLTLIFVIGCVLCASSAAFLVFHAQVGRAHVRRAKR